MNGKTKARLLHLAYLGKDTAKYRGKRGGELAWVTGLTYGDILGGLVPLM